MAESHNLLDAFAELSPTARKADLRMMLASAEAFSRQIDGVTPELQASPQLCEKKDIIIAKFDQLLKKLIGDDQTLNFTDSATEKAFNDAMQAWLDTESVYRLASETKVESHEAAVFALKKLSVEMKVNELTKKKVAEVVKKYPIKKEEIDGERDLILELIKLVEELNSNGSADEAKGADGGSESAKGGKATLFQYSKISAKLKELGHVAEGKGGSKHLQKGLKMIEQEIMKGYGKARLGKLAPSPEDVAATKNEVKKVLLELLQDPDFRAFMLKMGMMHMLAVLGVEKEELMKDQQTVADLEDKEDKASHEASEAELNRGKTAGVKESTKEEYKTEHQAFLQTSSSLLREIYIIQTIKKKIISFCEPAPAAGA